ncbi:hypothetical protein SAMN05216289_108125 [Dokdonella immobilis]|uniref:Uncharacterized protein n=2 Tax=Dokdonella immobilis TaxID=578942 RepID=A0A1I4XA23_9GAMM|nr:hypothetical protein SAMN05216289_108125 [Dokdonella immobilis]
MHRLAHWWMVGAPAGQAESIFPIDDRRQLPFDEIAPMTLSASTSQAPSRYLLTLLSLTLTALCGCALAGSPPLYHLTRLEVPGAWSVTVKDINNVGQAVGTYQDQDFVSHAVLWDDAGWHELAIPAGAEVLGIAYAINDAGQIVGTADDFMTLRGLLWNAATPDQYTVIGDGTALQVQPNGISENGVVVGSVRWQQGVPNHAFVWQDSTGLVDYGLQDPTMLDPDQNARWSDVNSAGRIVGNWYTQSSNVHATVGQVGSVAVQSMSDMTESLPSFPAAINEAGLSVGVGLDPATAKLVPVIFSLDGTFTQIPGAILDQVNGAALDINAAGVIVGSAGIGTQSGPGLGLKAWVWRDGTIHDLFDVVDDTGGLTSFRGGTAINDLGVIVGNGRDASDAPASFMLTPILVDPVFVDGFDPAP